MTRRVQAFAPITMSVISSLTPERTTMTRSWAGGTAKEPVIVSARRRMSPKNMPLRGRTSDSRNNLLTGFSFVQCLRPWPIRPSSRFRMCWARQRSSHELAWHLKRQLALAIATGCAHAAVGRASENPKSDLRSLTCSGIWVRAGIRIAVVSDDFEIYSRVLVAVDFELLPRWEATRGRRSNQCLGARVVLSWCGPRHRSESGKSFVYPGSSHSAAVWECHFSATSGESYS